MREWKNESEYWDEFVAVEMGELEGWLQNGTTVVGDCTSGVTTTIMEKQWW